MSPLKFSIVAFSLGLLTYAGVGFGISSGWFAKPSLTVEIIGLNAVVTFVIYRSLLRVQDTPLFINGYLLSIVLKLIFYSGLLLTIRILTPQALKANAILLMFCYSLFTILEVTILFIKVNR